ncbi:hypothetical protein [Streptomyces sp. bgisy159]|uniref:hypothetical protein n=1 Tax=Streptomyces sp. bgisy159 TaxID=3413795 RepID=UPI003F4A0ACE
MDTDGDRDHGDRDGGAELVAGRQGGHTGTRSVDGRTRPGHGLPPAGTETDRADDGPGSGAGIVTGMRVGMGVSISKGVSIGMGVSIGRSSGNGLG